MVEPPARDQVVREQYRPSGEQYRSSGAAAVRAVGVHGATLGRSAVTLREGLLRQWQQRNIDATVPHSIAAIRDAGNLDNFRRLTEVGEGTYRGRYPFLDTDVYKTLEGLAYLLAEQPSDQVSTFFDESVRLIEAAQADDGYLGSYYQGDDAPKEPWSDLAWGHELYNLGHLIQSAVAVHRQTGDDRLLEVANRFADLVWQRFGENGEPGYCGHPEIEMAMVELYRETGDERRLRQAELFVDRRGTGGLTHSVFTGEYFQDHVRLRELDSVIGHAVRMMYLAAGATDVAIERHDRALLAELERLFDDMVRTKLYLTGALGSRHADEAIGDRYELPSERAYAETCAAIGAMQWAWRLYLATGRADVLDTYERILYNAFAVGLSADGKAFFYDNPLQRRPDHQQRSGAESGGAELRRPWFGCPCCPPNVIRWMAELQDHLAVADDQSLTLAVIAAARIRTEALDLTVDTEYPWHGRIRITIDRASDDPVTLRIRRPQWVGDVTTALDEAELPIRVEDGFLSWQRQWQAGEVLTIDFELPIAVVAAHPYLDAVRGSAAITRGPLVYCLEHSDSELPVDDVLLDPEAVRGVRPRDTTDPITGHGLDVTVSRALEPTAELYPVITTTEELAAQSASTADRARATFIPYYLWGNREPGPMRVWIRRAQ